MALLQKKLVYLSHSNQQQVFSPMGITIVQAQSKAELKEFVKFPFALYKGNNYWVPPIKSDELKSLQPTTNPAYEFCEAAFWLAKKDGKTVGRIGAIINKAANEKTGEQLARLTRLEFEDDTAISKALLEQAENWAKEKGMKGVHGPLGFTNLDHQAVQIEGFDYLPSVASEYHMPYYQKHIEALGYEKEIDWVEFRLKVLDEIPEKAVKLNELIKKRYNLSVVSFNNKEEMRPYAMKVFKLLNEAFDELFSFVKMPEKLLQFYIDKYFNILNPKFVKVVEDEHKNMIGFIVSLPSLSKAMQKAKGNIFPFGWYHIMQALKHPTEADLLLTGIHPDWQAQGVSALLITELQQIMIAHGVKWVETTGMIETNEKAINHWKNYEHIQHKRKRCYKKMFL